MLKLAIYALLNQLTIAPSNESEFEKSDRMMVIAEAVEMAVDRASCHGYDYTCNAIWNGSREKLAAMLTSKAYCETRFAENVHAGRCKRSQCSSYYNASTKQLEPRSITLWQLERPPTMPRGEFFALVGKGLDETAKSAWLATVKLVAGWYACRGEEAGAFSYYATGSRCNWSGASLRQDISRSFEARISIELSKLRQGNS